MKKKFYMLEKFQKQIKSFKASRIYSDKRYKIFLKGNIYENKKNLIKLIIKFYINNKFHNLANQFNGNYIIFFYDYKKNYFFISNSTTSYFDVFYKINKKKLNISNKISDFLKSNYSINKYRTFEWLLLGGRALTNETFLNNVNYLLPGETISIDKNNVIKIYEKKYSSYKEGKQKITPKILVKSLKRAIDIRTKIFKQDILLGLSGGMDSRILAGLINNKKTITYTYGHLNNFEKIFAQYISFKGNFKKHIEIDIKEKEYFPKKIWNNYSILGNLNSTFQHDYQSNMFKNLSKKSNSKNIVLGCALDLFLSSSFSNKELVKIKNLKEYYLWFKKKYFLFSKNEIKIIFPNDYKYFYKKLEKNFFGITSKFNHNNFVDLNDALHFEVRILRWYNRNLNFVSHDNRSVLTPTYDKEFLNLCFKTNYKLRIRDYYRKEMLKNTNHEFYQIPTLSSFLPPSSDNKIQGVFKKIINKLENLNTNHIDVKKIPSLQYDVNLSKIMTESKNYNHFKKIILKKFNIKNKSNVTLNNLFKVIFFPRGKGSLSKIKKIIFLLSYLNILVNLRNEK